MQQLIWEVWRHFCTYSLSNPHCTEQQKIDPTNRRRRRRLTRNRQISDRIMVLLHHQSSSRKRPSSFNPQFPPPKIPKSSAAAVKTDVNNGGEGSFRRSETQGDAETLIENMVKVLAEAGCTLVNPAGPPCLPSEPGKLRRHLDGVFSGSDNGCLVRSDFVARFSSYVSSPQNLRRVLIPSGLDVPGSTRGDSLVRSLLLVPSIQLDIQNILLEKIPEYFDVNVDCSGTSSSSFEDDVARLILNHFRWLDFLVDPNAFTEKLMQVLSICPLHLKKEIIGSLPEIIGDQSNNSTVVNSLEEMLQEDSAIIVPVLDSLSNLNLDNQLQEQVTTIAISFIRTIDVEHMPYLLRFLVLSATPSNARRIISQIREHLKFIGGSISSSQSKKHKGKSLADNSEASILGTLKSSLRFKHILCQEILKELKSVGQPKDHKVIDIWLLMIIYSNGDALQKSVGKIFSSKIIEGCIQEYMIDQCICGNKDLVQDYFNSFLSLSEYLLGCKEKVARDFAIHMYSILFEEFKDTCSRQEVLGAIVTCVGSDIGYEVTSAMEAMVLLVSKYSREMIPLSCYINGILDYLEGFSIHNLHMVYEVFSHLALSARSSANSMGSSIANDLLMIVRKQVSNPDLKYKKMGIIGTLKIVSCLGDAADNHTSLSSSQKTNCEEALELLKASLTSCKNLPLPLILFYDELAASLTCRNVQPEIMEWICQHVGEFESLYLVDLVGGKLPTNDWYCDLEGELWMNLDGDISPVCLNILPLASSSSMPASSLQILPTHFLLLSTTERLTNRGSLGGIDALLGCPLYLPSSKYFSGNTWLSLTGKQKQILCLSLYYAANWIRELLNAFCTQVVGRSECISQATKEDIIPKLLKRLRNLVFLESLLNNCLKQYSLSLPDLCFHAESSGSSLSNQPSHAGHAEKKIDLKKKHEVGVSNNKKKLNKKLINLDSNDKSRQPTIMEALRKAGALTSQETLNENSSSLPSENRAPDSADSHCSETNMEMSVEISAVTKALEAQKFKFRPLLNDCFSILTFSKYQTSCCADPEAELSLHMYLLRDLHNKLDYFAPPTKQLFARIASTPAGLNNLSVNELLRKNITVFPSLRKQLDGVIHNREDGVETCEDHWKVQSASAGNPDIPNLVLSKSVLHNLFCKELLHCFSKILNLDEMDEATLLCLLEAFQPLKIPDSYFASVRPYPSPGSLEYLYCGTFSYMEGVLDIACSFPFAVALESLISLESIVKSIKTKFNNSGDSIQRLLTTLCNRLGSSAHKLLRHNWEEKHLEGGWKRSGEIVQRTIQIYLENSEGTSDLLDELACSILPQVPSGRANTQDDQHGFSTLCSGTFVIWYRVLNEQNLAILNHLVKEIVHFDKPRAGGHLKDVKKILLKLQQSVNVVVSLVNLCRSHDKVTVHAMAVKYGGKFVDSFLKVFDFLQAHFEAHNDLIIQLVKELQKATRTIQTLCSEAKGLKQTVITCNIPSTKRSMERFIFCVKALLHTTSSGCSFWMGNLKHKDLTGQVVSSQAYVNQNEDVEDNSIEVDEENLNDPAAAASEEDESPK